MARCAAIPTSDAARTAEAVDQLRHHCVEAEAPSGHLVVLHVPSGTYLRLEGSAADIVSLLVEHGDAGAAATALSARFAIPMAQARDDVASVVRSVTGLRAARASQPRRPTWSGMRRTVGGWVRLPPAKMLGVAQATVVVLVVEVGLRTTDLDRLARWMGSPMASTSAPATRDDDAANVATLSRAEQRNYWAATWVLDRWVYDGTCLRRALATGWFLRRHHPELHLGLIDEGETSHAWIEAAGMSFNAIPVTGVFVGRPTDGPLPRTGDGNTP
ncbi:MAG TPA: lasso peptide biosynthesis B2 protein [Acidimicrobiales bacterium]